MYECVVLSESRAGKRLKGSEKVETTRGITLLCNNPVMELWCALAVLHFPFN